MSEKPERKEGRQNVVVHEGTPADPDYDTNEGADERAEIVEPDGSPSPRAGEEAATSRRPGSRP